jgi:hypothetical protein
LLSSAWAGWGDFDGEVEVEAAKALASGLCSDLSSCHLSCTSAVEEGDYDGMYPMDDVNLTFKKQFTSNL